MKSNLKTEIELDQDVEVVFAGSQIKIKGPTSEVQKMLAHPKIKIAVEGRKIVLTSPKATKREKMVMGSFEAHLRNAVRGVKEPYTYKLKICSGHFPMTVTVSGEEFIIKNFLGESVPRKVKILPGVSVKVDGTLVIVTSPDKEQAGQMAGRIENLCRITNRDIRIFQDGCYITHKCGKDL